MPKDFHQIAWNHELAQAWARLLELAITEDLGSGAATSGDLTTLALVPEDAQGRAAIVARQPGILAGEAAVETTLHRFDPRLSWQSEARDGDTLSPKQSIGRIEGPTRALLAAERPLLNLLGHLSGIASLTGRYVQAIAGTSAHIYDTRKTTPGWRILEKYAVRCGGGRNHRTGLFEAILIKDNHLAFGAQGSAGKLETFTPAEAVVHARAFLKGQSQGQGGDAIVEIEVDDLDQFDQVLLVEPDLILLDNMGPDELREAVRRRDERCPGLELEASGGIDLDTVRRIAESGVERISVGALTHSAIGLDFGLDWG